MERMQDVIKMASAAAAGLCTVLWGGADAWLMVLLLFLLLDYCSGVAAAIVRCELSSRTGFRGLLKKLLVLLIAAIASRLDALLGAGGALRSLVLGFYIANEGISLLENAARCGVPVPQRLTKVLGQLCSESPQASADGAKEENHEA